MANRTASFRLAPRPRSQSLLRKIGCLGGLCGLFLSALLVFVLMVGFQLLADSSHDAGIPNEDVDRMDKNEIVQPLFINETRFDVLASIWSPYPTNGSQTSQKGDHVYWKGVLQENVTFSDGYAKNVSLTLDLDLRFLWSLPKFNRYSLRASVIVIPRMETTALSLPENSQLVLNVTNTVLTESFPMNLSPLSDYPHISDYWRDQILTKGLRGALPVHTVPLLLVLRQELDLEGNKIVFDPAEKYPKFFINTNLEFKLSHRPSSFGLKKFLKKWYSAESSLGSCLNSLSTTSDDRELTKCYNTDFHGPFQSRIEFVPELQSDHSDFEFFSALKNPLTNKLARRAFFVPYLVLGTSPNPRDLVPIFQNKTLVHFNWTSKLQVTSEKINKFASIMGERSAEAVSQEMLAGNARLQQASKGSTDGYDISNLFKLDMVIVYVLSLVKSLLVGGILLCNVLYFYTRATTSGVSVHAVVTTSLSFFGESVSNRSLLTSNPSVRCDAIDYSHGFDLFATSLYCLALQQLWFAFRLKVGKVGRKWPLLSWLPTIVRIPADHSERQTSREDGEFSAHHRLATLMFLTLLLAVGKPSCLYLQMGAIGGLSFAKNSLSLVLLAIPQAGRILGELQQVQLNRRKGTFAGAFKTTIVFQALRHCFDLVQVIIWSYQPSKAFGEDSLSTPLLNSSSILLTGCWVWQMLKYKPIVQIRDEDEEDQEMT